MSASSIMLAMEQYWNILLNGVQNVFDVLNLPISIWYVVEWVLEQLSAIFPDAHFIDDLLALMPDVQVTVGAMLFGTGLGFLVLFRLVTLILDILP